MNILILHLGSNLGDRQKNLEWAIELIVQEIGGLLSQSSYYETQAWLGPDPSILSKEVREQAPFLNIALQLEATVSSFEALEICMGIEKKIGRVRHQKWSARLIDIDLIFYDHQVIRSSKLILPHLWMQDRRFVLLPLAEIIPNWVHPVLNKNVQKLLEECNDVGQVELYHP